MEHLIVFAVILSLTFGQPSVIPDRSTLRPPRIIIPIPTLTSTQDTTIRETSSASSVIFPDSSSRTVVIQATSPFTSDTVGVPKRRVGENEKPIFKISPDTLYPYSILVISYAPETPGIVYKVNFTDLSAVVDSGPPASYELSSNPFQIYKLSPGHQYRFEIYGQNEDGTPTLIHTEVQMTDPRVPEFSAFADDSIQATTTTIELKGRKGPDYLQDYYIVTATPLETDVVTPQPLNISDVGENQRVEILISQLQPGTTYNVSVVAYRFGRRSMPFAANLTTEPLPVLNLTVVDQGSDYLEIHWMRPDASGMDKYHLKWQPDGGNTTDIELNDESYKITKLFPGQKFTITVFTVKGTKLSQPSSLIGVKTKPLSPLQMQIVPNFVLGIFQIQLTIAAPNKSRSDRCRLTLKHLPSGTETDFSAEIVRPEQCSFDVPELQPGQKYSLESFTLSYDQASLPLIETIPIPPAFNAIEFQLDFSAGPDSLKLEWPSLPFWTNLIGNEGELYGVLQISESKSIQRSHLGRSPGILEWTNLTSGSCYDVQIYSQANGIESENKSDLWKRTELPKLRLEAASIGPNSAILRWSGAKSMQIDQSCRIRVQVRNDSGAIVRRSEISFDKNFIDEIVLDNLVPYSRYHSGAEIICGKIGDKCVSVNETLGSHSFITGEAVPSVVENFKVAVDSPYKAELTWDPPEELHGVIDHYTVLIEPVSSHNNDEIPWNISVRVPEATIQNLTGGRQYTFVIYAANSAGYGPPSEPQTKEMVLWKPPVPNGRPKVDGETTGRHKFEIDFTLGDMFSTQHGLLIAYAVIVAEGSAPPNELQNAKMNWTMARNNDIWPPYIAVYQVLPESRVLDHEATALVIGSDDGCERVSNGFCNGPLKPGAIYRAKIRAYTHPNLYTDTEYSDPIQTASTGGISSGGIAALVLIPLLLILLVIATLVFIKMRGIPSDWNWFTKSKRPLRLQLSKPPKLHINNNNGNDSSVGRASIDSRVDRLGLPALLTLVPGTEIDKTRPVPKEKFAEHYRLMSADSDFRFSEEFEDLKNVGRNQACNAADLPSNRVKNRFSNILPFDQTRVKLNPLDDDEEGGDYINANYIPGHNSPREFIATQGPLPATRDDFWRLVWEQNSPAIINLTKCVEKGREKCDFYWPHDNDPACFGRDICLQLMNESRYPDWTIREFRISQDDVVRTVRQFHFTAWPDFGVPDRPQTLIRFVRAFRAKMSQDPRGGPIVIHCSAGVGRSGTFIALDRILQELPQKPTIDVFGLVREMRMYRVWMVQTEQQYICIHQCVLCVLQGREDDQLTGRIPSSPAEVHQNPVFEDDEGIAESGV